MENDIWNEISSFLNQLRCENINRESYIYFQELANIQLKKKMEKENNQKKYGSNDKKRQKKTANPTEMQNQKTVQMDLLLLYENLFISPLIC